MLRKVTLLTAALACVGLCAAFVPRAQAVPMWARSYGYACADCHAFPSLQLTATGLDFLRRGHRMEGDTGEKNFANLLSAHGEWNYALQEHSPSPFSDPEFHLHAGGPLTEYISTYADANINSDFEALYIQFTKVDGPDAYVTAKAGRSTPDIIREYAAGLMAPASTPLIISDVTLGENPFTPDRIGTGVTVAQKWKRLFVEGGVANGEDVPGQAAIANHKDAFASAEISMSKSPTGVGVYYFNGGYDLVTDSLGSTTFDRYDRMAAFANYTCKHVRLAGSYVWGREQLGTPSPVSKISGCYVQADVHPAKWITPFARYDWVKTENIDGAATVTQGTLGFAAPIYYAATAGGRLTVEASRVDDAGTSSNAAAIGILWAY